MSSLSSMATCWFRFSLVKKPLNWPTTAKTESIPSSLRSGAPISTAMTISAPWSLAMEIGRLFTIPPSDSSFPSRFTGARKPGTDMLACSASAKSPSCRITSLLSGILVATARKGTGNESKLSRVGTKPIERRINDDMVCPCRAPFATLNLPSPQPILGSIGNSSLNCLSR